jgi:hypothetical protein
MYQSIMPAYFEGLKEYVIRHEKAVGIQPFGKTYADVGELNSEETATLAIKYSNYNTVLYYAKVPDVQRNFVPIIGGFIRNIIGVNNTKYLVIDFKKFIKNTLSIAQLVKNGYPNSDLLRYNRILAIKILLLRNLSDQLYTTIDPEKVYINFDQIHLPCPKSSSEQEGLPYCVSDSLRFITAEEIITTFNNLNSK